MNTELTTNNLAIGYSHKKNIKTVANGINISLQQGKLTCLMGPNGIGKSTLIKTLTGVLAPLTGEVIIDSKNINSLNHLQKAQTISMVLTEKPSAGYMNVRELISLGRFPYTNWQNSFSSADVEIVDEAIKSVGLVEQADSPLSELSDGNFQKAIIGRALAQDTAILILDEPTIHLDVNNKTIIIKLLQKLSRLANKSILVSTHDLELAMSFADKLWLFSDDNIIEGIPEDLAFNGSIYRVFSETNMEPENTNQGLDHIEFGGSEYGIMLLKQAIVKRDLQDKIENSSNINIELRDNTQVISYEKNNYISIEDFLDSLINLN
jgi:iron complex transport system ATP-binding protein